MNPFIPKQVLPKTPAHYEQMVSTVTEKVAAHILTLLPAFEPGAIIHDNGCGTGQVSAQIMATQPPAGPYTLSIQATDSNEDVVRACAQLAAQHGWPVEASVMPAQALTFPEATFTHSFLNFVLGPLVFVPNGVPDTIAHIHRTLQPGGWAAVTMWAETPYAPAVRAAHDATRPPITPRPLASPPEWEQASTLRQALEEGGFAGASIRLTQQELYLPVHDLAHWAQLIWSFLGQPATGWLEQDEAQWDRATAIIEKVVRTLPGFQQTPSGEVHLRMRANIALATK